MSAIEIANPFLVVCRDGALDGFIIEEKAEPKIGHKLSIRYEHSAMSTPDGTTKATRTWRTHHYIYIGAGKATPLNDEK